MTFSRKHRAAAGFGVSIVATLAAFGASADPALNIPRGMVLPPLSVAKAQYFRAHPAEWKEFLAGLAQVPAATPRATTTAGGTWTAVTKAPFNGLCNPLLLTDATVIVASCDTKVWYKLTPDNTGSYANGTWAQIASLPVIGGTQYRPQYHALRGASGWARHHRGRRVQRGRHRRVDQSRRDLRPPRRSMDRCHRTDGAAGT